MANQAHPVDDALIDFRIAVGHVEEEFRCNDGIIDEREQRLIDELSRPARVISMVRFKERATDAWIRAGNDGHNKYVRGLFRQAGAQLAPLSNVIQFPGIEEPQDAA